MLDNLHHASIIFSPVSSFSSIVAYLKKDILKNNIVEHSFRHTDLIVFESVSIGTDDINLIVDFNSRRALGKNKVMIISTQAITMNAQNALLKIIEEPASNTFFFFIIPSKSQVLPTLLSRFREIALDIKIEHYSSLALSPENFLKQPVATRMDIIKEIIVFLEKEKVSRGEVCEFITDVIALWHKLHKKPKKENLKAIVAIEHFMRDTASSMKLCLEYLALAV